MGKSKEAKQVNKNLSHEYDYQNTQRDQASSFYDPRIASTDQQAADSRSQYTGALDNLTNVGNQFLGNTISADTGALKGDSAAYKNFAQGNGETGQFFRNLMNTGGYSEGELGDIRSAGNRVIPSFFSNLKDRMRTAQNATGGYSPGYSAGNAAMARDMAHQSQDAALNTELGISDRVRTGKLTGAENLNQMFLGGMGGATDADKAIMSGELQASGQTLQSQGMGANLLSNVAQGYGNLNERDVQSNFNNQAMKMKQQGMSSDAIYRILMEQAARSPNKGFNWAKAAAIAAAGVATIMTGGAAAPLLVGAIGSNIGGGTTGPKLWGNNSSSSIMGPTNAELGYDPNQYQPATYQGSDEG
jgi:hypothetical protein